MIATYTHDRIAIMYINCVYMRFRHIHCVYMWFRRMLRDCRYVFIYYYMAISTSHIKIWVEISYKHIHMIAYVYTWCRPICLHVMSRSYGSCAILCDFEIADVCLYVSACSYTTHIYKHLEYTWRHGNLDITSKHMGRHVNIWVDIRPKHMRSCVYV